MSSSISVCSSSIYSIITPPLGSTRGGVSIGEQMSYDIYLADPISKEILQLTTPHHMTGGTYALGGTTNCYLNVTWNYGKHYGGLGDKGLRTIYGMTGAESLKVLEPLAESLSDDTSEDYWEPTEGNAKRAILQLIALATMRPDGVWEGD